MKIGTKEVEVVETLKGMEINLIEGNDIEPLIRLIKSVEGRLQVEVNKAYLAPDMRGSWGQHVDIETPPKVFY